MKKILKINPVMHARKSLKLSQKELGEMFKVRQSTISKWEKKGVVPPSRVIEFERKTNIARSKANPFTHGG